MTVSSTTRKAGPFTGNGVTTVFPFTFKVFNNADVRVVYTDSAGTETVLALDAQYSVALNTNQDNNPGGAVTYLVASGLVDGERLTILSAIPETQTVDLNSGGGFYPQVIEAALDRGTAIHQQLREEVSRTLTFPVSDDPVNMVLPTETVRANTILGFDSNGRPTAFLPVDQSAAALALALQSLHGAENIGYENTNVADVLNALTLNDYNALRIYAGSRKSVYVTGVMGTTKPSGAVGLFVRDDADAASADNGGTIIVSANGKRWKRVFTGAVNLAWFGAVGDGVADDTAAFIAAIASGAKRIHAPAGRYALNPASATDLVIQSLSNVEFTGDGSASVLFIASRNLLLKSPSHVRFKSLRFEGNPANTDATGIIQSVWVSNFVDVLFDDCEFAGFGGQATYPDSTNCLWLYAGPASSKAAAGNSEGALVTNCRFYGSSRHTNFGVRVFTEWGAGASLAYSNIGAIIKGCTFGGFNWNACEIAGPMTSYAIVSECVANACGLTPFDIDKGASHCQVKNVTINRLLGNIDTNVSQSTRAAVVAIQGETNVGRIALNNQIDGVVANLLAADIQAFAGFGGYCGVGYSNAKNCSIKNVKINIDAVPTKNAAASWAFAAVCFEHISGCETDHITTVNASHGIMETAANIPGVGSNWNEFRHIRNIGTMTGEIIWIGKGSTQVFKHKFEDIKLASDMTTVTYDVPAINLIASAPSPAIVSMERVYVSTSGFTVLNPSMANVAVRELYADYAANSNHVNFFMSGNNLASLHYGGGVYFNGKPLDVFAAFAAPRLPTTCFINTDYVPEFAGSPVNGGGGVPLYATDVPTNPPAANWAVPTIIYHATPSAGAKIGWVNYGGFWKAWGPIDA